MARPTLEEATLSPDDLRATIVPSDPPVGNVGGRTMDTLEQLRNPSFVQGSPSGFELGGVLGEGGMGIVRSATQRSLGRDVAVKTLRPGFTSETAVGKLLREAWITGSLEHPNIVPVYDLGLDERGAPMLVLKRISGVAWHHLLGDAELVRERFGAADPLEWHLRILMQVCSAIHFAHRRGIVHRDIKPDNVMIGEFGEVYVVDWGIAVALHDDGTKRFPLASEATEMAGTLLYMAPEMFGDSPDGVTERTDVYLLGAMLYEVVTGWPPHGGDTIFQVQKSLDEPPPVPEGTPAELPPIWLRAMARASGERYASAEEFRLALQGFLDHRSSTRLAAGAVASLRVLDEKLRAPEAQGSEGREEIYNLFGECAFGFRQALADWPGNEPARRGLRDATASMLEYEIVHGDTRAARLLLGKLDPPDETFAARIADMERALEAKHLRVRALERLGDEVDPNAGRQTRGLLMAVLGVIWVVTPLITGWLDPDNPNYAVMFRIPSFMLAIVLVGAFLARRAMMKTAMNRAIIGAATLTFASQMILHVGSALAGVPPDESQRVVVFGWFIIITMMTIAVSRRLTAAAVAYLLTYLASSRWFAHRYEFMSAANAVLFATMLWAWWARTPSAMEPEASARK